MVYGHVHYFIVGEFITRITGNNEKFNANRITFHTNHSRVFGPYGSTSVSDNYDVSPGTELSYLSGRSGMRLDQLVFHFKGNRLENLFSH